MTRRSGPKVMPGQRSDSEAQLAAALALYPIELIALVFCDQADLMIGEWKQAMLKRLETNPDSLTEADGTGIRNGAALFPSVVASCIAWAFGDGRAQEVSALAIEASATVDGSYWAGAVASPLQNLSTLIQERQTSAQRAHSALAFWMQNHAVRTGIAQVRFGPTASLSHSALLSHSLSHLLPMPSESAMAPMNWDPVQVRDYLLVDRALCKLRMPRSTIQHLWLIDDPASWSSMSAEAQVAMDEALNAWGAGPRNGRKERTVIR